MSLLYVRPIAGVRSAHPNSPLRQGGTNDAQVERQEAVLADVLRAAVPAMDDTTRAVVQNAQGKCPAAHGQPRPTALTRKTRCLRAMR